MARERRFRNAFVFSWVCDASEHELYVDAVLCVEAAPQMAWPVVIRKFYLFFDLYFFHICSLKYKRKIRISQAAHGNIFYK